MKRAKGEGTIFQRKDGRWQAAIQVNGVRKIVYGKTRKEAVEKLEAIKAEARANGILSNPKGRTVGDMLRAHIEANAPKWKPRTLRDWQFAVERYFAGLRDLPLAKLEPSVVQKLVAEYQLAGKHKTALRVYRTLSASCRTAVRYGWLANNPCDRVEAPRYRPERKEVWSVEQLRIFLSGARNHKLFPLWLTAICTGARLGELLALTWADIAADLGAIRINKSAQRIDGEWVVLEPKTASGNRVVPVPQAVIEAVREVASALAKHTERVFPYSPEYVAEELRKECERLGLPKMTMHGLRHLHGSLLLAEGLPVPEVSQRLGHSSPAITMAIYAHALRQDRAVEAIERVLS
jgi:integrase